MYIDEEYYLIYIYVCICKLCNNFYIGQAITALNIRINGHRAHFRDAHPEKSALAQHIAQDHANMMHEHTNNFKIGILIKSNPLSLSRLEDRFIIDTLADTKHLNRYKPVWFSIISMDLFIFLTSLYIQDAFNGQEPEAGSKIE